MPRPFISGLKRGGVVLGAVILALGLAEMGMRIWSPIPTDRLVPFPYNEDRLHRIVNNEASLGFDSDLGWIPTPDHVRREEGVTFQHNREGLRADHEYSETPPEGVARIAAFGDSFTYCAEVSHGDCWVTLLEQALPDTEVLNFGVPGYGPDQAWLRYQRDGRAYHPCAVLIDYFVEDIERVVNRFRPFIDPADSVMMSKPRFLLDGDGLRLLPNPASNPMILSDPKYVERTLGDHDAWFFPGTFISEPFDNLLVARLVRTAAYDERRASLVRAGDSYPLYDEQGEAFQVAQRILVQFAAQVRADGLTPILLIFPGKGDLIAAQGGSSAYQPFIERVGQSGILPIDLTPLLSEEVERRGIDAMFNVSHYSPAANRIVADYLAQTVPDLVSPTCPHT